MEDKRNFWTYLEKWQKVFPKKRKLAFKGMCLENDYCRDCRFCCGPQGDDEPFPMALLPNQLGPDNERDFFMLNANTAYLGKEGCKSLTPSGCRLPQNKRPVACGLFPIVLANGRLYLYLCCPAVILNTLADFATLAKEAENILRSFSKRELEHISITLAPDVLAEKYIDLGIQIF